MDTIETLRTFVRVVETGSLSAVAREMNASQSTVSRQITSLEEHFGVRLFHRTTRHLSLTDDGENLHEHAITVIGMVEGMETALGQDKSSPSGHVRVATPVSLGLILMERVPELMARYPSLSVELMMDDNPGDMIEQRLDLAIRSGEVVNQSLIKRSLGAIARVAVAAPGYLDSRGVPLQPSDLTDHECIVHQVTPGDSEWRLIGEDGLISVTVHGALSTNNHAAVRGAALGGLGIALLPEYQIVDDVRAGRLQLVLPDYTSEPLPAYLVYPSRRHLAPRTRVVIDFLIEEVQRLRSRRTKALNSALSPETLTDRRSARMVLPGTVTTEINAKEMGRRERRPNQSQSAAAN
jgi:DNA-binding transcriptional LysR family regulator